jgi:gluconate:H+ symporter, GntP family
MPGLSHHASLLLTTLLAIGALILFIARFKLNAFVGLILASLFVGLGSGMNLPDIAKAFQEGVGNTLGFIAIVVGLGTILGKLLAESGGAEVIAQRFVQLFGTRRVHWALLFVSFIIGLPVFFGVGLVLLIPIVFTIARETRIPLLHLGIPVVAGLSVAHGLVPPHPGPLFAIEKLEADVGKTIFYSIIIGLPTAIVAGPLLGSILSRRVSVELGGIGEKLIAQKPPVRRPGFALALFTVVLPVLLMLLATIADIGLPKTSVVRQWADFIGSPLVAMLIATLVSFYTFGSICGFSRAQILKFTEDCVGPAAMIFLVVGAGGGFSKVLDYSGVDDAISNLATRWPISPLLLGWVVAALIRVAVGSATVAVTMATAIMVPIAVSLPGTNRELLVLAMGAGSLILSHLNDGGFWFVKEYYNLSVSQTLRTWTLMETLISVVALIGVLLLDALLH